jgi:transcriptional regulator with PAS, ATPase and Fis domain
MWQLKIEDPSGETRFLPTFPGMMTLGKDESCAIPLRDPVAPREAAYLWPKTPETQKETDRPSLSPFWIRIPAGSPACLLGDLSVREAQLPAGLPLRIGETRITIEAANGNPSLPAQPASIRPWLTRSEAGISLLWMAKKAAATPLSLYLAGETGTGKEVLASLLHAWSERAAGPFVPLHCGALALSLVESELFGHVKGAFTGAIHQRPGALMQAHNGTLFLDEVGDLPMDIQVKLLRFLENGEIRPVGADRTSRADVRLVCATHQPLEKLVKEGKFRQDLYYRLASVTLSIPPLRSRPKDVDFLAQKFSSELGRSLSPRALLRLKAHAWPGNVRELRHAIERASGLAGPFSPVLPEDAFDFLLTSDNVAETPSLELGSAVLSLHEMERVLILKALKLTNGNRGAAAKILGVARSTLFEMLKRHRIMGPRRHPDQAWDA